MPGYTSLACTSTAQRGSSLRSSRKTISTNVSPWLPHPKSSYLSNDPVLKTGNILVWALIYCLGLVVAGGWTSIWIYQLSLVWSDSGSQTSTPFPRSLSMFVSSLVTAFPIGIGVWRTFLLLRLLFRLLSPPIVTFGSHVGSYLARALDFVLTQTERERWRSLVRTFKAFLAKIQALPATPLPTSFATFRASKLPQALSLC
jgi:hypothetical protein